MSEKRHCALYEWQSPLHIYSLDATSPAEALRDYVGRERSIREVTESFAFYTAMYKGSKDLFCVFDSKDAKHHHFIREPLKEDEE